MSEFKFEKKLGIRTSGLKDWHEDIIQYNRCEPTPYKALEKLFKHYQPQKTDRFVDFGCGKGRVAFYVHNRFNIPVTGIEGQEDILDEALENRRSYMQKLEDGPPLLRFMFGLAEEYSISPEDTVFFFFNPFSADVFYQVLKNILNSLEEAPRRADLILYYPFPAYEKIMELTPEFVLIDELIVPEAKDAKDKFLIYRYGG